LKKQSNHLLARNEPNDGHNAAPLFCKGQIRIAA